MLPTGGADAAAGRAGKRNGGVLPRRGRLSAEVLASRFGAPEDVAAELQRSFRGIRPAVRRRKRLLTRLVLAACLMAVVLSLGFAVHVANHDVHYVETQIFYD